MGSEGIYRELGEIKLGRFVEILTGNVDMVVKPGSKGKYSSKEMEEAADKLCYRYLEITGGRTMQARLSRRNEMLKLEMRLSALDACRKLVALGNWEGVRSVLEKMGYSIEAGDRESLKRKVESLMATCGYRLEKLCATELEAGKNAKGVTKEELTQERVAIMSRMKMHIDPEVYTALEYAYLVKRVCEEMESGERQKMKS